MPDTSPTPLTLFLAENDVPCPNPKCGFNLRGLKDATCPECRESLVLNVGRPDTLWSMRKWVVGATLVTAFFAALKAEDRAQAMYAEFDAPWIDWTDWTELAFSSGAFIGLVVLLFRYVLHRRQTNGRALLLLLHGLLVATVFLSGLQAFWRLWSVCDRLWGIDRW